MDLCDIDMTLAIQNYKIVELKISFLDIYNQ